MFCRGTNLSRQYRVVPVLIFFFFSISLSHTIFCGRRPLLDEFTRRTTNRRSELVFIGVGGWLLGEDEHVGAFSRKPSGTKKKTNKKKATIPREVSVAR